MVFGTKVQMQINSVWTDVTRYDTQTKILQDGAVTITRGRGSVQDRTPTSTATWTWLDPNGVYLNDNPRSPYYGVLPRNTPVRAYVQRATPALYVVDAQDGAGSRTADKAQLQIVGDIDIRLEIEPTRWRRFGSGGTRFMILAAKYGIAGARSWMLRVSEQGLLTITWNNSGGGSAGVRTATAPLPATGRIAIKVTIDVDNGASGNDTQFFTAPSINGSYTQLGATVTAASVSSIFNAATPLEIGTIQNGAANAGAFSATGINYLGRVYAFQLRNGIGGTLVASPDFTAQTTGTTSFADGLGNTWALSGVAEITNADYRFHGEFSAPNQRPVMSRDGTGVDVRIEAEAGGLIRRLSANATPLQSPIYRNFNTYAPNGWWPGEDTSGATQASSAVDGSDPAQITDITFSGFDTGLAGSAGVMTLGGTGPLFVGVSKATVAATTANFYAYFKFPTVPLSGQTLFSVYGTGTIKRWDFIVTNVGYTLNGYDVTGTQIVTKANAFGVGASPTNWIGYHMQLTQSGGNVNIDSGWHAVGTDVFFTQIGTGLDTFTGSVGYFSKVVMQGVAALSGVKVSQIMVTTAGGAGYDASYSAYSRGYSGETADARFTRISREQGIRSVLVGALGDAELMGPQPIDEVMNVLYECADVDGGFLSECRDQLALQYQTRTSLYNQYGLQLNYTQKHLSGPLESTPDDTNVKNDVTLNRKNGGSARAVLNAGPMSILAPPNGIGRVPDAPTINNYQDGRLPALAQYALGKGTWPEARYPSVVIALHRSPFVNSAALLLLAEMADLGGYVSITGMPTFMPPDDVNLMVQGVTETLNAFTWDIEWNTSPYGYWKFDEFSLVAGEEMRADSARDSSYVCQTQLAAAVTSTATSLSVKTLTGPLLATTAGDPTQYPADIFVAGERMTVTAVTGTTSPQTVTVTRSVNAVVKAQLINAPVTVVQGFYTAP